MPILTPEIISHGTVPCHNIEYTIDLLTNLFGFQVARTSKTSASFKLNDSFTITVLQSHKKPIEKIDNSKIKHHFGIDMKNENDVNNAYTLVTNNKNKFKIKKITKPTYGHGTYFFYIVDNDSNYWEILMNPINGNQYKFTQQNDTRLWKNQLDNLKAEKQKSYKP